MARNNNSPGATGAITHSAPQISTPVRVLFTLTLIAGLLAVLLSAVYAQDPAPSTPAAATPDATPSAAMPRVELKLQEENASDIGGKVTLYEFGDKTIVDFDVTGAGGGHLAEITRGVCGSTADNPVADLEDIDDHGKSHSVIDTSLTDLLTEDHSVQLRMSKADKDTVIACAFIEGTPTLGPAGTPVATPATTPAATPTVTPAASPEASAVGGNTTDLDGTGGAVNANGQTLEIVLADWSNKSVTGTAVLSADGDMTQVNVTIAGPGVVGGHEVHIHNGTCASPGTATYTLNPIDANGTSTSTVNLSIEQLARGNYFINVHPDEENWDAWMVCGNINGQASSVSTTKPATTGSTVSDGSVGGNTTLVTTNAQAGEFPSKVGVGDGLRWPSDTRTSVTWAVATIGTTMLLSGLILRHGERSGKKVRYTRLGL